MAQRSPFWPELKYTLLHIHTGYELMAFQTHQG